MVCIKLWFGRLNIKRETGSVTFSERYHIAPTCVIGSVRLTWRGWTEASRRRSGRRMRALASKGR